MKPRIAQRYIMTLKEDDYVPFLFFISSVWVLAEVEDKWKAGEGMIKVSILLSTEYNISALFMGWEDWKENSLATDYAILN